MPNPSCPRCNLIMCFDTGESSIAERRWYYYNCSNSIYINIETEKEPTRPTPRHSKTSWRNIVRGKKYNTKSCPSGVDTNNELILRSRKFGEEAAIQLLLMLKNG